MARVVLTVLHFARAVQRSAQIVSLLPFAVAVESPVRIVRRQTEPGVQTAKPVVLVQ